MSVSVSCCIVQSDSSVDTLYGVYIYASDVCVRVEPDTSGDSSTSVSTSRQFTVDRGADDRDSETTTSQ